MKKIAIFIWVVLILLITAGDDLHWILKLWGCAALFGAILGFYKIHKDKKRMKRVKFLKSNKATIVSSETKKKDNAQTVNIETFKCAVSALVQLGFQKSASQKVVESVMKNAPHANLEQIVKESLKTMRSRRF